MFRAQVPAPPDRGGQLWIPGLQPGETCGEEEPTMVAIIQVYSRVNSFLRWILDTVHENEDHSFGIKPTIENNDAVIFPSRRRRVLRRKNREQKKLDKLRKHDKQRMSQRSRQLGSKGRKLRITENV